MTLVPLTRPANGEVFVPIVIEMAGSSTVISGSATGSSGSASVSPIMISGIPAMAMMSPGTGLRAGLRSSASVMSSSVILTRSTLPSWRHQADLLALRDRPLVDAAQRDAAEERRGVQVGHVGL